MSDYPLTIQVDAQRMTNGRIASFTIEITREVEVYMGFKPIAAMANRIADAMINAGNAEIDMIHTELSCGVSHVD